MYGIDQKTKRYKVYSPCLNYAYRHICLAYFITLIIFIACPTASRCDSELVWTKDGSGISRIFLSGCRNGQPGARSDRRSRRVWPQNIPIPPLSIRKSNRDLSGDLQTLI